MAAKRGENHHLSRLRPEDVLDIRQAVKEGVTQLELSNRYDVCVGTISAIVSRRSWKHI